jgi:ribonucleoside-diphosphate reductase alpha chain
MANIVYKRHSKGRVVRKKAVDKKIGGKFGDSRKAKGFFKSDVDLLEKTKLKGLRKTVFMDRYSVKGDKGEAKEMYPEQMWYRVARGIAQFEPTLKLQRKWNRRFYDLMKDFKFVPAGRILSGAGTGYEVTFFNCYVLPSPSDSREGIMENITHTVEIQARAGGVGINLSTLRPRGARVKKVNGTSSGPVNWASLYSSANHDVIQQGGSRRGALMLMLNDWHPDIEEFIKVKQDLDKIPGANLSLCVSDKFMEAVKNDEEWSLVFPDLSDKEYDEKWDGDIDTWKKSGKRVIEYKKVRAKEIWDMIAEAAWKSAEPGVVFMERYNKMSNTHYFENIMCVNPCGEQGLGAWGVCNLGSMNLSMYVSEDGDFDYESLKRDVKVALRFMDDVIDANFYFFEENKLSQENIRRTGLGTMGLGDLLIKMKIRYGSKESLSLIEKIYRTIRDSAYMASVDLAKEKGVFAMYEGDKFLHGRFIKTLPDKIKQRIKRYGIRNAVILTQAPTGTTSLLAGVSSGIEPNYDFEFKRTDRTGEHTIYHPLYKKWKVENQDKELPGYFVGAKDLSPEEHVLVQAKVQEYTDSSISKTVNAPKTYSVDDVRRLYTMAYDLGCKGIAFFRDGSRQGVLESVEEGKGAEPEGDVAELLLRPEKLTGSTYKIKTPVGTAFVVINSDDLGNPFEVFINVGKAGTHVMADAEAIGRLLSTTLRIPSALSSRAIAEAMIEQMAGIGGAESVGFGNGKVRSLADGVAKILRRHFDEQEKEVSLANGLSDNLHVKEILHNEKDPAVQQMPLTLSSKKADLCPDCGQAGLVLEEGCSKCYFCGVSKC